MGAVAGKQYPDNVRKNGEDSWQEKVQDNHESDLSVLKHVGSFDSDSGAFHEGTNIDHDDEAPQEESFVKTTANDDQSEQYYDQSEGITGAVYDTNDNKDAVMDEAYDVNAFKEEGYQYQEGKYEERYEGEQYQKSYDEAYDEDYTTNEYNKGYGAGYAEGYETGLNEAYDQAYKSYQEQLKQLIPQTKYQLTYDTLPKNAKKYWKQRYSLFRKFDQGVYMTSELWFSVTPESLALFVAKFIQACYPELKTIVDVCCGGGGNTIQFARRFDRVIAIDINDDNLYCTKKNCEVYGVMNNVELKQADWTKLLGTDYFQSLSDQVDLVFSSPPWGGPGYKGKEFFDLNLLQPMPIKELLVSFFKISPNVVLFLPRNSNLEQLAQVTNELLGPEAKCRILYTYQDGFIKGIIAFWGKKFLPENYMDYSHVHQAQQAQQMHLMQQQMDFQPVNTGVYQSRENRGEGKQDPGSNKEVELDY